MHLCAAFQRDWPLLAARVKVIVFTFDYTAIRRVERVADTHPITGDPLREVSRQSQRNNA
jgi:hypothetical protein